MTHDDHHNPGPGHEGVGSGAGVDEDYEKFLRELRQLARLAENVLERVEPALRRVAAAVDQEEWDNCSWCPVCAAAAVIRGEHHDLAAMLADHGVTLVTVLREAIAGVPVDPVMPEDVSPKAPQRRKAAPEPSTPTRAYQSIPVTIAR